MSRVRPLPFCFSRGEYLEREKKKSSAAEESREIKSFKITSAGQEVSLGKLTVVVFFWTK